MTVLEYMTVLEAYMVINRNTVRSINTKRNLNDWEVEKFKDLMSTLEYVQVSDSDHQVVWNPEKKWNIFNHFIL